MITFLNMSSTNPEIDQTETDEDEEVEDENVGKVIDVAFEARPPNSGDFHGIKRLLQQLFVKYINEDLSELANLIVAQDSVGSVLKQDYPDEDSDSEESDTDEEDGNVYSLNTVINLSENQSLSCIEKINELLSLKCEENFKTEPGRMKKLLNDPSKQIGLLISERFINIPSQVALPSYKSLQSDIEEAIRKKKKFKFSHLILISKTYKAKGGNMSDDLFYSNPEEQLFNDVCEFKYTFSVADQRDSVSEGEWDDDGGDFESLRTVMTFDASALGHMIAKLQSELPSN
ncbi:BRCA2 and CDKN1A-interacting protein-like isoform X2 [Physella acuta]|uniref:BRCA2 and CDKN1A-interacting protein-like isoform X2 n=1 Tax=Physella acuta TaxID=109671 RepID=UPI0027DC971C|nr:BRCA2 and CDKN1A-interacting protein-like isoform X2 [Physella acuta]